MGWKMSAVARTVAAVALGACMAMGAQAQGVLRVGVVLSTSGPAAVFEQHCALSLR